MPHRTGAGTYVCPILYRTDADVWTYHREHGLAHCELYDQGFKRLGCIGCPMAGSAGIAREFARWPRYAAWWERAVKRHWREWIGKRKANGEPYYVAGFASAEAYWQWWLSGERKQDGEECQGGSLFI